MTWTPYRGERYFDHDELEAWCVALAAHSPRFIRLDRLGASRQGRPILLLTVADHAADPSAHPAFWLDGGTHAAEWTGVMATLYTLTRWVEALEAGDPDRLAWFSRHTAFVCPCISPDGLHAMVRGAPHLRSTLRPPRDARPRVGLQPVDLDGDGRVRWMRWRHPSGPWVFPDPQGPRLRRRGLDDPPGEAFFVCPEGEFLGWDGVRWTAAALEHGLDLNRNFPGSWAPFGMFGMDGGDFPLSEPESRAVVDAFRARPTIAAAVTNHTYTGALLTQPYRDPSPLPEPDIVLMEDLAREAVAGTGYRVLRTHPDFTYDPKNPIVGVWADTMSATFGVPGYTLELWDPFTFAGVPNPKPGRFWLDPDAQACATLLEIFAKEPGGVAPWRPMHHPQLGAIEVGGLDLARTMHNPPPRLLPAECERGYTVADRVLRALPDLHVTLTVTPIGGGLRAVRWVVENRGYLPSSALTHAERLGLVPPVAVTLEPGAGQGLVEGPAARDLGWLDGWGTLQAGAARHPLYPGLPFTRGVHAHATWVVRGEGPVVVTWDAGRGGRGQMTAG